MAADPHRLFRSCPGLPPECGRPLFAPLPSAWEPPPFASAQADSSVCYQQPPCRPCLPPRPPPDRRPAPSWQWAPCSSRPWVPFDTGGISPTPRTPPGPQTTTTGRGIDTGWNICRTLRPACWEAAQCRLGAAMSPRPQLRRTSVSAAMWRTGGRRLSGNQCARCGVKSGRRHAQLVEIVWWEVMMHSTDAS